MEKTNNKMKRLNLEIERWSKTEFAIYVNDVYYENIERTELLDFISRIVDEKLLK